MTKLNKTGTIVHQGGVYSSWVGMAKRMELTKFVPTGYIDKNLLGLKCVVININENPTGDTIFGIHVPSLDRDYIIHSSCVKMDTIPTNFFNDDLFSL